MNEIIITDDQLQHFNIRNSNTESALIYTKDGTLHTIVLERCAENYYALHGGTHHCVAERDITKYTFTFYTSGLKTVIKFRKKFYRNALRNRLLSGDRASRFQKLQNLIEQCGYTSYDLS